MTHTLQLTSIDLEILIDAVKLRQQVINESIQKLCENSLMTTRISEELNSKLDESQDLMEKLKSI